MRWEGAAKWSEGSRAWGCKHCRGREEGIWRNRSQRWVDTEYVTAPANRGAPPPRQSDDSTWAEYYVLMNRTRDASVISASQSSCRLIFLLICGIKASGWIWIIIEIISILLEIPLWPERNVVDDLGVFLASEGFLCPFSGFGGRLCSISSDRVDITPRPAPTKRN